MTLRAILYMPNGDESLHLLDNEEEAFDICKKKNNSHDIGYMELTWKANNRTAALLYDDEALVKDPVLGYNKRLDKFLREKTYEGHMLPRPLYGYVFFYEAQREGEGEVEV